MVYKDFYREKDGGIQAIVSYKNSMGKWKQKSKQGFENNRKVKNEVKEWVRQTLMELEELAKGKDEHEGITYIEFVDKFLESKKQTIEYNTYISYKNSLYKFTSLFDKQVSKITPLDIKEACNSLSNSNSINK